MKGVEVFGVRLAISGGNSLHAVYILESFDRSKSEDRRNHIWRVFHQSKEINALNKIPIFWPTQMPDETDAATETQDNQEILEMMTALPPQKVNFNNDLGSVDNYNPAWSVYVSVIAVSFFIFLLLIFFIIKRRN
jgi:hypothetical protein